jgi:hypothetical protein
MEGSIDPGDLNVEHLLPGLKDSIADMGSQINGNVNTLKSNIDSINQKLECIPTVQHLQGFIQHVAQ